ncbi:hypothetical protein B0T21DRAFT_343083 [Apiosordaria backusii]|uniref:Uncharacterized protein n=1 Tax=Apiosordaria backusii TaxID=314023 RepID=A0AA40EXD0_9PEZI|nr:hypothetical protein B0T21DRAFT_343083 [Apiosordaria backusii]
MSYFVPALKGCAEGVGLRKGERISDFTLLALRPLASQPNLQTPDFDVNDTLATASGSGTLRKDPPSGKVEDIINSPLGNTKGKGLATPEKTPQKCPKLSTSSTQNTPNLTGKAFSQPVMSFHKLRRPSLNRPQPSNPKLPSSAPQKPYYKCTVRTLGFKLLQSLEGKSRKDILAIPNRIKGFICQDDTSARDRKFFIKNYQDVISKREQDTERKRAVAITRKRRTISAISDASAAGTVIRAADDSPLLNLVLNYMQKISDVQTRILHELEDMRAAQPNGISGLGAGRLGASDCGNSQISESLVGGDADSLREEDREIAEDGRFLVFTMVPGGVEMATVTASWATEDNMVTEQELVAERLWWRLDLVRERRWGRGRTWVRRVEEKSSHWRWMKWMVEGLGRLLRAEERDCWAGVGVVMLKGDEHGRWMWRCSYM